MKVVVNIKGNINNHFNSLLLAFAKYIYCNNFLIFCFLVLSINALNLLTVINSINISPK